MSIALIALFGGLSIMTAHAAPRSLYELSAPSIDGKERPLAEYKGKVALVVNTASECGYTPQYKGLQALYERYKERGLVVLGFPSNDFGAQAPGSNEEIRKFCELKFRTTFPLFSKAPVKGKEKQPVFRFLTEGKENAGEVAWNFEKFLVDREGRLVARFPSKIEPGSPEISSKIESLLGK